LDSITVTVTFAPTVLGAKLDSITINHNASGSPGKLYVSGRGYVDPSIKIDFTVTDNGTTPSELHSQALSLGLDASGTDGIDMTLGESGAPPFAPAGMEARLVLPPFSTVGNNSWKEYRGATFPFTGPKVHRLAVQPSTGATNFVINFSSFALPAGGSFTVQIQDLITGTLVNETRSAPGSVTVPTSLTGLALTVTYTNVTEPVLGPSFSMSPASLNFSNVAVGSSSTLPVTVSNTGTAALSISNITSSNAVFTFAPAAPISIPAGGNTTINVTFTPTGSGPQTGSITITHDATGSPSALPLQGTGTLTAPSFSMSPTSLNFGNIGIGQSWVKQVTISNTGNASLSISNITSSNASFTFAPASPISVPAGGNATLNVTFSPTAAGSQTGTIALTHNAAGSPSSLSVSGTGTTQGGNLVFRADTRIRKDATNGYVDTLDLMNYTGTAGLKALQFKLISNYTVSNVNNLLMLKNVTKGNAVSSPNWTLNYEVKKGSSSSVGGASKDTFIVLLYNTTLSDSDLVGSLKSGNYTDLLRFEYDVIDIAEPDTQRATIKMTAVRGSLFNGTNAQITADNDQEVTLYNKILWGDVNNDNSLDILDLIKVVDHILERKLLTGSEFVRADLAPWLQGSLTPSPDTVVNVQDLAVLQNIILTGKYPNGTTLNKLVVVNNSGLHKSSLMPDVKLKFYITDKGIAISNNSQIDIRGIQLECKNIDNNLNNMIIETGLGQGYYAKVDDLLRVLLYDQDGKAIIGTSESFVANIPFSITDPSKISIDKIIVVNKNNEKVSDIEIEILYSSSPDVPVDYSLLQNFPNPFNPTTTIKFSLPKHSDVKITIYNSLGEEIRTLLLGNFERGTYSINWDGKDAGGALTASGMYIYKMTAGDFTQSRKMIFMK
jgi:hypothetical protein